MKMSPVRRLNRRGVVNAKVIRKWSRCSDAERYLQNGLSRFFVRVPTRAQPASSAGCTVHGTADEKSELGARPGHQRLFRWAFPRMAGEVRRASGGGPARRAAHPEMVESRRAGGWETNTCGGRGAPERWMAVANALGQRGSKCVTAAPWKSPLMAWSTVCDDYFRVADNSLGRPLGLPSRNSVGCLDCVAVHLLLMHGCGRSVGPICNHDQEHKNRWQPLHLGLSLRRDEPIGTGHNR